MICVRSVEIVYFVQIAGDGSVLNRFVISDIDSDMKINGNNVLKQMALSVCMYLDTGVGIGRCMPRA